MKQGRRRVDLQRVEGKLRIGLELVEGGPNLEAVETPMAWWAARARHAKIQDSVSRLDPAGAEVDTGRDQAQRHHQPDAAKQCDRLGRRIARARRAN